VNDYVPYEERVRQERQAEAAAAAAAAEAHRSNLKEVMALLSRLGGDGTDCYLEILQPLQGLRRYFNSKTTVTRPELHDEPEFVIGEVLSSYRIAGGIIPPRTKEGNVYPFDAYVVPDGRVWRFSGEGVTANTYQLLESSAGELRHLSTDDLERIAADLRGRQPRRNG
jgi:hypothetical protein